MKYIMLFKEFINEAFSEKFKQDLVDKFKKQQPNLNPESIQAYISRFEKSKDNALIVQKDITKYTWKELETALDSLPVTNRIKAGKIDLNSGEEIYNKNGLRVYPGSTKTLCIKYGNGYSWCISARGDKNLYDNYRTEGDGMPYFIFDDSKPKSDPTHAAVVFAFKEGTMSNYVDEDDGDDHMENMPKLFTFSNADNKGDAEYSNQEELLDEYPYLDEIKDLLVYKPLVDPKEIRRRKKSKEEHILRMNIHNLYSLSSDFCKQFIIRGTPFGFEYPKRLWEEDLAKLKEVIEGKSCMCYVKSKFGKESRIYEYVFCKTSDKDDVIIKKTIEKYIEMIKRAQQYDEDPDIFTPDKIASLQRGYKNDQNTEPRKYIIFKDSLESCKMLYDGFFANLIPAPLKESTQQIKTFREFVNEGYVHSFDNEDMSPSSQQRKREQEARDERAYNARQHASQYQAPRSVQSSKPAPQKASTALSAIASDKSGEVTFPFAALLGQVKKALQGLTTEQRTKAKKGTAIFKQGMDMYYNALNARTCKEKDKRQYNEDAKECADTEDLFQLIELYIEEYESATGKEGDGTVYVPRKQPAPEDADEKAERMRHNWY